MATIPIFNKAGLLSLLGNKLYYNYFATEEGGAGNSNNSADESSYTTTGAEDCTLESLVDNILLEASLEFERTAKMPIIQDHVTSNTGPQATRFCTPKSSEDVAMAIASGVPKKTQADTKYCVELWKKWSNFRNHRRTGSRKNQSHGQWTTTVLVESIRTWSEKKGRLWVPSQYTPSYLLWSVETKWTSRSRSHVFQLHCYFGFGDEAIEILGIWQ